jgi:hypothetical protein
VTDAAGEAPPRSLLRPWHFVIAFGIVSLLADMVYEGARSIIGPYLATLGASATVVGVVAGRASSSATGCGSCPGMRCAAPGTTGPGPSSATRSPCSASP